MKIKKIKARKISNAIGTETVEILLNGKYVGSAPLGISRGRGEVLQFPSQGSSLGVLNKSLNKHLRGVSFGDFKDLKLVEDVLSDFDSSEKLEKLSGSIVVALENALLRGAAGSNSVWKFLNQYADEVPIPIGEVVGGGKHFTGDSTDFQEFLVIPHAENFYDNAYANHYVYKEVYNHLKPVAKTYNGSWVTTLDNLTILDLLKKLSQEVFDKFDVQVELGLDVAGSHMYSGGYYFYKKGKLDRISQIRYMNSLITKYGLEYVEDPLEENDSEGFGMIRGDLVCGDDLVCSRIERLKEVEGKINSIVVIPSQVGSLLKCKELIDYAKKNNITPILSHRAGETNDDILAELAVGWEVPFIKCGTFGKERLGKINRLKAIEKEIG